MSDSKSQQLLDDIASHDHLRRGVPETSARRVYGNRVVNRLLQKGIVESTTVELGNGFHYIELVRG